MTPLPTIGRKRTKYPGVWALDDGRYLVLRTWTDRRTGRRTYRRAIVSGTLEDAERARANLRAAGPSGNESSRPRFATFAADWLAKHRKKLQPSTYDRYLHDVAHLTTEIGEWWVDAIDYDGLEDMRDALTEDFAAPTINGWHRTLRLILDGAVRRRLLASNPARELSALPEGRAAGARGTSLSLDQFRAFLAAIPECVKAEDIAEDVGRQVVTIAWTGMRLGESCALPWDLVVEGEVRVERSVWRGHEKPTKTDDPRRVTVTEALATTLEEQRRWLLTTQHPGLSSGLVFPAAPVQAAAGASRREGDVSWYRSQATLQQAMRAICKRASVPRVTPHSLRRSFEDRLREAGVEQLVRRAIHGWRTERAQGIYTTVEREERDAAAAAVTRLVLG